MIAEFLRAEIDSTRFGKWIISALEKKKKSKTIVRNPNIKNRSENLFRKELLGEIRGFGKNKDYFEDFPNDFKWYKAVIQKQELKKVKYINYGYWNKLSNETRLPSRAVKNIKSGIKAFGVSNKLYFEILSEVETGRKIPPMIFIAKNKKSRIVVLEGHARLTAYFLNGKNIPKSMEIIMGYSEKLAKWSLY